jgi:PAS domain S-box-containing protein
MPSLQVEMSRLLERVRALDLELKQAREVEGALRASASEQNRAAQEQLLASEARFHHLVDAVTDYAIFMLDPTGHVATWNPGAKKAKGYDAEEILGRHFSVFYTPEDREAGKPDRVPRAFAVKGASRTRAGVCARTARGSGQTSSSPHSKTQRERFSGSRR